MYEHVRQAKKQDIPEIVSLWQSFMTLLQQTNSDYWEVKGGKAAFSSYLAKAVDHPDVLVAIGVDQELMGFGLAQIETLPEWFGSEKIGMIRYLAVSESHQGKGLGWKISDFILDWFRAKGIKRVELYVLKDLAACGFWSRIGFKAFMDRRFKEI